VAPVILFGSDEQKKKYLTPMTEEPRYCVSSRFKHNVVFSICVLSCLHHCCAFYVFSTPLQKVVKSFLTRLPLQAVWVCLCGTGQNWFGSMHMHKRLWDVGGVV